MVDIDLVVLRLGKRQHNIVTRAQLGKAGATRFQIEGALRRGVIGRLHRGVFVVGGGDPSHDGRVLAAAWATGGFASHRCAGALFGLRRIPRDVVEITVTDRSPELKGVTVRTMAGLDGVDRTRIGLIPVLHPAVVLLQLAGTFPELVEGAFDDALVRRITSLDAVERVVGRLGGKGRPGSQLLRRLIADRRGGQRPTESALEDDFVAITERYGLSLPVRQLPLATADGPDARCDFGDVDRQLDFEVDGDRFHAGHADQARDAERDSRVRAEGWTVRRFTTGDIRERPDEVAAVLRALQLRRRDRPRPQTS